MIYLGLPQSRLSAGTKLELRTVRQDAFLASTAGAGAGITVEQVSLQWESHIAPALKSQSYFIKDKVSPIRPL
jgi:hypothetical protein